MKYHISFFQFSDGSNMSKLKSLKLKIGNSEVDGFTANHDSYKVHLAWFRNYVPVATKFFFSSMNIYAYFWCYLVTTQMNHKIFLTQISLKIRKFLYCSMDLFYHKLELYAFQIFLVFNLTSNMKQSDFLLSPLKTGSMRWF